MSECPKCGYDDLEKFDEIDMGDHMIKVYHCWTCGEQYEVIDDIEPLDTTETSK